MELPLPVTFGAAPLWGTYYSPELYELVRETHNSTPRGMGKENESDRAQDEIAAALTSVLAEHQKMRAFIKQVACLNSEGLAMDADDVLRSARKLLGCAR